MSVTQSALVDAIGIDKRTNEVILTIADHLPWDDQSHLEMLQAKLNTYLAFVESRELLATYPDAANRAVCISLVLRFQPNPRGLTFLNNASQTIRKAGFAFSWRLLDSEAV
jgi:hypothetical protein